MEGKKSYFYVRTQAGIITGPFPAHRLAQMKSSGRLKQDDTISTDMKSWVSPFPPPEEPVADADLYSPPMAFNKQPTSPEPSAEQAPDQAPQPEESLAPNSQAPSRQRMPANQDLLRWNVVLASIWTGGFFYPEVIHELPKAASWLVPYCIAACILPWVILPPQYSAYPRLFGASVGVVSLGCLALVSFLLPVLIAKFSKKPFLGQNEEILVMLYSFSTYSVAYGSAILLRDFAMLRGFSFWLPAVVLFAVLSWMCVVQGSMSRHLACRILKKNGAGWIVAILLTTILFIAVLFSTIYFFGGYR